MIFKGTWMHGGIKFDKNAKVLWRRDPTCGIACVRKTALVNHPSKRKFIGTSRWVVNRWWRGLDGRERDKWWNAGLEGVTSRRSLTRRPCNGYILFQSGGFVKVWLTGETDLGFIAGWPWQTWVESRITAVNLLSQTVSFKCVYTIHMPECIANEFATYQVDPRRTYSTMWWRHTRLIDLATMVEGDPWTYTATRSLAWKMRKGDTVQLFFRGRSLFHYCYKARDKWKIPKE